MSSLMQDALLTLLVGTATLVAFILVTLYVVLPLFKGIYMAIGGAFRFIGWIIVHIFEFIAGVLGDALRFVGSLLVMLVLLPLVPLNIVIGRWSAAGHFAESFKRECHVGSACVYRAVIRRPLKFLLLDGVLEGLEQRLPEAMAHAPGADQPSRRVGQFDGYRIVGSLRSGGSGAKLYVAEPDDNKRRRNVNMPQRVVIKAFALTEGSSLPQIVRESRALECAKQLGHVLDHGMDDHRFFYVMPYHAGEHLGVLTRQFHAECGGRGLDRRHLNLTMSHIRDLLATLSSYHEGGLWHKDVKPENVIVHDGRAHLVDLGLVTPLRSAMTLTTHGTEYFRDPEMVRQALRGVKVHQVDGGKFDIYAAGAVLYFMIENTFPAHGGLSHITMSSPEALRWIVRRSMTEYNQRYASADDMLRDLDHVMAARDPYAVKPAELPSMSGASAGEAVAEPPAAAAAAGNPAAADPFGAFIQGAAAAVSGAASTIGAAFGGKAGSDAAAIGSGPGAGTASPPAAARTPKPPKIVVTNWWTGAYRVEDEAGDNGGGSQPQGFGSPHDFAASAAGISEASARGDARMFRHHARVLREQAAEISRKVGSGKITARRAAKEQIRAAKERAREMRARATAHRRHVALGGRHPSMSPWLFVIGFFTIVLLGGGVLFGLLSTRTVVQPRMQTHNAAVTPMLLVVDVPEPDHPRVRERIAEIVSERTHEGYDVIDSTTNDSNLRTLVNQWSQDRSGPADEALEDVLEAKNAYGILHVKITGDARRPVKKVTEQVIRSTRPGAADRRRVQVEAILPAGPAPSQPYLLINDHPAKTDPEVEAVINEAIASYRANGWDLRVVDDVEVAVRKLLPPGKVESTATLPFMLHEVLEKAEMGGVVRIEAAPGEGKPRDRVIVTIINREDVPKMPGSAEGTAAESVQERHDASEPVGAATATQPG